ncbi:MAG: hypothetical protein JWL77_4977 [Chthonomonadaceae bacterium]|nr:hypothetical protein [Chthonomonadaceae bacterium]
MTHIQPRLVRFCLFSVLGMSMSIASIHTARADVVGQLRLHVQDAENGKPLAGVQVVLSDTAGIRPTWALTTDKHGDVRSLPLENRGWQIVRILLPESTSENRQVPANRANGRKEATKRPSERRTPIDLSPVTPDRRQIRVIEDTTTEAFLSVDVSSRQLTRVAGTGKQVFANQVGNVTRRDQTFLHMFPGTAGNPLSLDGVLQTVPRLSGRAADH